MPFNTKLTNSRVFQVSTSLRKNANELLVCARVSFTFSCSAPRGLLQGGDGRPQRTNSFVSDHSASNGGSDLRGELQRGIKNDRAAALTDDTPIKHLVG